MEYRQRERATKFLTLTAEALAQLEGMIEDSPSSHDQSQLDKMQHELVNLQTRFSRLIYVTTEAELKAAMK